MITLWTIAGVILGWIGVEFIGAVTKVRIPILFNIGVAFVGGLTAYTILS